MCLNLLFLRVVLFFLSLSLSSRLFIIAFIVTTAKAAEIKPSIIVVIIKL
jgi:hypothetical protein